MENSILVGSKAQDFQLTDVSGKLIRLSDYFGKKQVVLIFNRGFA